MGRTKGTFEINRLVLSYSEVKHCYASDDHFWSLQKRIQFHLTNWTVLVCALLFYFQTKIPFHYNNSFNYIFPNLWNTHTHRVESFICPNLQRIHLIKTKAHTINLINVVWFSEEVKTALVVSYIWPEPGLNRISSWTYPLS